MARIALFLPFAFFGSFSGVAATPLLQLVPVPAPPDLEASHRKILETSRRELAFLEEQVAFEAKLIADCPAVFNPERSARFLQMHAEAKKDLVKQRKWVQELERHELLRKRSPGLDAELESLAQLQAVYSELWRGVYAAPMPREVKR
jgi:hypothetical protein